MIQSKPKKGWKAELKKAAAGAAAAVSTTLVLSGVLAWLVLNGKLREEALKYSAMGILAFSAFAGCLTAAKRGGERRIITALCVGALYYVLMLLLPLGILRSQANGALPTLAVVICSSMLAGMLQTRQSGSRKPRKFKGLNG